MKNARESLWLPAAILAAGVALMLAMLTATERPAPASHGSLVYPAPCLYLPVIRMNNGAAQTTDNAFQIVPAATPYPPPTDQCGLPILKRLYLPVIRR
jgi:hypothetical protein